MWPGLVVVLQCQTKKIVRGEEYVNIYSSIKRQINCFNRSKYHVNLEIIIIHKS